MDFLETYLAALGGTATALLIAGTLGKTLLEHWFKKDFKRFESKLDELASRDETRFLLLHSERVRAVKEIYPKIEDIYEKTLDIDGIRFRLTTEQNSALELELQRRRASLKLADEALRVYVKECSPIFSNKEPELIDDFLNTSFVLAYITESPTNENRIEASDLNTGISNIQQAFKKILGSDTL